MVRLPNSDGTPGPYPHPCIYCGESRIKAGHAVVMGITSDLSQRVVGKSCDMPWAPGKHPVTGLDRPSIAQTHSVHHVAIPLDVKVIGVTPEAEQIAIGKMVQRRYR